MGAVFFVSGGYFKKSSFVFYCGAVFCKKGQKSFSKRVAGLKKGGIFAPRNTRDLVPVSERSLPKALPFKKIKIFFQKMLRERKKGFIFAPA